MNSQPHYSEAHESPYPAEVLPPPREIRNEFSDDLKGVFDTLRRRRGAFLLGFLPAILGAAAYLYLVTPLYTANAIIVLDPRKQVVTTSPEVLPDIAPDSSVIDTQVQLIQSRAVTGRAADQLALEGQSLESPPNPGRLAQALGPLKRALERVLPAKPTEAPYVLTRPERIDAVAEAMEVSRIGLTSAIRISYTSEDAAKSATVTNAIAAAYLAYQADTKQQATKDANLWLKERVGELKERVESAESAVDRYRSRSGLLIAKGSTSTESEVTNLDLGLNEAQQRLSEARAKLDGYQNALRTTGAAEAAKIVATPMMQTLRGQYTALTGQQAQLSPTLGPSHPQMVELKRQIDSLQAEMSSEARRTIEELKSDVAIAERKVDGLLGIRNRSRTQLAQDNAANVELTQLQANAQSLRQLYEDMVTRLQQTSAQESRAPVNATVVSEALPPSLPSSPQTTVIIMGALVVGLALGALAVMFAQFMDTAIVRPKDLEYRTHVPILALVPQLQGRDLKVSGKRVSIAEVVLGKPMSLFAEAFRNLRVAVQHSAGTTEALVVQITSGTFAEGKTVCSIAFAQAAAMDGRRVLLIDADVRRRSLTKYLGITAERGLMELLSGKATLYDVLLPGGEGRNRPDVIPLSTNDPGPHDRFSSPAFDQLLERLKIGFDLIVIDSAPVLAVAESLALAKRVDAVVVVTRWAKTPLETVIKALEAIQRVGGRVAGMLLTRVDMKRVTTQTYGKGHYPALMKYYQQ